MCHYLRIAYLFGNLFDPRFDLREAEDVPLGSTVFRVAGHRSGEKARKWSIYSLSN